MRIKLLYIFCFCSILVAAQKNKDLSKDIFLEKLMQTKPEAFASILANKDSLNVQIIYTQIDRDKKNNPSFTNYTFNLNNNNYFYPASTVKMPIAFLALEKLNNLNIPGVNKYTKMVVDSSISAQQNFYAPTNTNSNPTIANYIKQIFLVSDNDAFNHLYEFLGQEYIQQKLKEKGYSDAVIRHRLNISLSNEQNRTTNAVSFYDSSGKLLYHQDAQYNKNNFASLNVQLGKGYYRGNQLINEPFDFSTKNRIYLQDLHDILQSVLFSDNVDQKKKFNLTKDDVAFVLKWMSAYPRESKLPYYDSANYWDSYCKFLLYGSEKGSLLPDVRIFNKVGDAYGFLTDIAYIVDKKNNVEFMLCATISCNSDGIYNDDKYDYETVGYPFMKHLGQLIYQYELKRDKKHKALLNKFDIEYKDK